MARLDKFASAFKACSGPYKFSDFENMLLGLGYAMLPRGHSAGSRRKYFNSQTGDVIMLDKPHDGEMGRSMVRRLQKQLKDKGAL